MEKMKQKLVKIFSTSQDENILVIKHHLFFGQGIWQGIKKIDENLVAGVILKHKEFHPRSLMECDPSYKQIIPYMVFNYQDKYFLMQRKLKASETRLQSKYSLGIGGHIRQEDIQNSDVISWAYREFHEEVRYSGNFVAKQLGILNDESNEVGKVHIGFVYLLTGNSDDIRVKDELQSGQLLTLSECKKYYNYMEEWSKIVFDFLSK